LRTESIERGAEPEKFCPSFIFEMRSIHLLNGRRRDSASTLPIQLNPQAGMWLYKQRISSTEFPNSIKIIS
jgi:hypothetical protein